MVSKSIAGRPELYTGEKRSAVIGRSGDWCKLETACFAERVTTLHAQHMAAVRNRGRQAEGYLLLKKRTQRLNINISVVSFGF